MKTLSEYACEQSKNADKVHEGETDQIHDCTLDGGLFVIKEAIEQLRWRMNPDNLLSASEYWYLCGIQDAISVLNKINPTHGKQD